MMTLHFGLIHLKLILFSENGLKINIKIYVCGTNTLFQKNNLYYDKSKYIRNTIKAKSNEYSRIKVMIKI